MRGRVLRIGSLTVGLVRFVLLYASVDQRLTIITESSLKAFADKHDIPVPQPRTRDTLLQKIRSSYETVAKRLGETAAYPGNWIYASWSESGELFSTRQSKLSDMK